ncbi:MAG TPA: c-type cytochrome domain-containing protein, partial [Candidatus Limnocylindria bacterium]|nr:c-type cytochrome domain-containing protein [Candidatus Limnocylindria bacterium]
MHRKSLPLLSLAALLGWGNPSSAAVSGSEALAAFPASAQKVEYQRDIEPLFKEHCYGCHGDKRQESGLRLDNRTDATKGGDHGLAWISGKSAESTLIQVVAGAHAEIAKMPKKGDPLTPVQVGTLRAWIDQGAVWPVGSAPVAKPKHWAFVPIAHPVPPKAPAGSLNPLDNFVFAQ